MRGIETIIKKYLPRSLWGPLRKLKSALFVNVGVGHAWHPVSIPPAIKVSETSKCRDSLSPYCVGMGIDVGFGGDPISPSAIAMDLPNKYADYAGFPQHLAGNAGDLYWFQDGVLDWVYSSHVLEDFAKPEEIFAEWLRVVRVNGRVVLFLPDEQKYRAHCKKTAAIPNRHHHHADFSPGWLLERLNSVPGWALEHLREDVGVYSFEIVFRKTQ